MNRGGRFAADVEPEPGRNAARLPLGQWRRVVRMSLERLQHVNKTAVANGGAVDRLCAVSDGVKNAQIDRIHAELARKVIDRAFYGEGGHGSAWGAISGDLRPVRDDVIGDKRKVFDVVTGKGSHRAEIGGRAGESARLVFQRHLGSGDLAGLSSRRR